MELKITKKNISKFFDDPLAIPPEVVEKFGHFGIRETHGYLYAAVPHHRLPEYLRITLLVPLSRLVWLCHYPSYRFRKGQKTIHINRNKQDNRVENLYPAGGTK
jgi:hypothetical protein